MDEYHQTLIIVVSSTFTLHPRGRVGGGRERDRGREGGREGGRERERSREGGREGIESLFNLRAKLSIRLLVLNCSP